LGWSEASAPIHRCAPVTDNVVFTTTYSGYLYAFNTATGAILPKLPLSAGTNAPVTIDGNYVITGAGVSNRCCPWKAGQLAKAIHILQERQCRG